MVDDGVYSISLSGVRQSPINIETEKNVVETDEELNELAYEYVPENCTVVGNTGSSWKVDVNPEGSSLSGGPLDSTYQLAQFHAHWGGENGRGSEHTVDGKVSVMKQLISFSFSYLRCSLLNFILFISTQNMVILAALLTNLMDWLFSAYFLKLEKSIQSLVNSVKCSKTSQEKETP